MKTLITKLTTMAFMLNALFSTNAHAVSTCENVFSDVPEFKQHQVELEPGLKVSFRRIFNEKKQFKAANIFGESNDIFLGVTEYGHAYLVSQHARLDGEIIGRRSEFNGKTDLLDAGIIIRIKAKSEKSELSEYDGAHGVSCSQVTCSALKKASGVYIGINKNRYYSPYEMLQAIFKHGIRDGNGQPVPFEVYYVGKSSLAASLKEIKDTNAAFEKELGKTAIKMATGASALGATLLWIFGYFNEDK